MFLGSAGVCLFVGRAATRWLALARCVQPTRYEDCPPLLPYQHAKQGTPTMGGLVLLGVGGTLAALAGGLRHPHGWLVLSAIVLVGGIGFLDDFLKFRRPNAAGLPATPKLVIALLVGALVGALASPDGRVVELPWTHHTLDLGWGWMPFAMLVVAGCAHAVNLTDGMDGLAAGCVALALVGLGIWALANPSLQALVPWCAGLAGACVGFLWFNSFPASVFLGDVGALGLGAAVGSIALLSKASLWLLVIGGVFVCEAVSVMLQVASYKWRHQRRIFRVAPLHHHFHLGGISEPKLIVRFWIAGLLLAALSLTGLP